MARSAQAELRSEQRAARRRAQILDAARACVRAEGFHAASMSRIAAAAGMTAGHIYQYFKNKEAVMFALSELDFEQLMLHIRRAEPPSGWNEDVIIETIVAEIPTLLDYHSGAIALEIQAEAGRNPKVADLVSRIDSQFRDELRRMLAPVMVGLSDEEIVARTETLLIMLKATALYAVTHPVVDVGAVSLGYKRALRGLLSPATLPPPIDK
ncbi:TetR/AcrR family transcriptional regulator [Sphingobium sp. 15-1]|nr:TetR/AcrR family transcriptional regulator [Sphingobium sp. 15-1]